MTASRSSLGVWTRQQLAQRAARKVVAVFEAEGIRCLLVKGVVVSRQLYVDPVERPYTDVDVRVRPRDFSRVVRVGRRHGWREVWDSKTLGAVNLIVDEVAFDIETTVGAPGVSAIGVGDFLRRARRSDAPLGFAHEAIELHDHALLLAIDAFKDKLGSVTKPWAAEDLARVAASDGFHVETMVRRAREARLATLVATVGRWVEEQRGETAWSRVAWELRAEVREGYARRYREGCAVEGRSRWEVVKLAALTRGVSDAPVRRVMAVVLGGIGVGGYWKRFGGAKVWEWTARGGAGAGPERHLQIRDIAKDRRLGRGSRYY